MSNVDLDIVAGFGDEWTRLDQSALSQSELQYGFDLYFKIFPWDSLPENAIGFDLGCGSGRWAKCVAPRVGKLHCIDASEAAIQVAQRNLQHQGNCEFHIASVDSMPLPDGTMDFGYALGVLHHVPNTFEGIKSCVAKLKPGSPFLLYLYYALDNRPLWFRALWKVSDFGRRIISRLPFWLRYWLSFGIAVFIYFPLARLSRMLEKRGFNVELIPLSAYRNRSFYGMRTDALDRFGTALEQRFTRHQIREMMQNAGLEKIEFSQSVPYWCAVGYKKA